MGVSMYRLIGIDNEGEVDYRTARGRNLSVYRALSVHAQIVGRFTPGMEGPPRYLNYAASFHPNPWVWKNAASLNPRTFRRRSEEALRRLRTEYGPDSFDVVLQIFGMFSVAGQGFPVALYLDNTMALTVEHYPQWNPMHPHERREWLALEREAYHRADVIFTMSEAVRRSVIHDYGCPEAKVITTGAGTNFTLEPQLKEDYGQRTALFVAYEFERNGGPTLLEAWRRVRRELPDARLWIVGPRRAALPGGERERGVEWFGPVSDRERLRSLFRQATLFTLPSLFNPFPHVLREAMALGLPCVSTRHAAIPEIVEGGVTGTLVPVGDVDALAHALTELLANPALARRYGAAGRRAVESGMSWEGVGERMSVHLAALAARSRARQAPPEVGRTS